MIYKIGMLWLIVNEVVLLYALRPFPPNHKSKQRQRSGQRNHNCNFDHRNSPNS